MEQYFQHPITQNAESTQEEVQVDKLKSRGFENNNNNNNNPTNGSFDCNICLDLVHDPVVTICGHLYCWPCIYKWIIHSKSPSYQHPQCPVCKAKVSENTLIPLFGRGQQPQRSSNHGKGSSIPHRPNGPGCGLHTLVTTTTTPHLNHQHVSPPPAFGFAGTTTYQPMIGMFGDMIYARMFGNSETTTTLYSYPNTYNVASTSSARARRHVMHADRSLSRLSFFLCCCVVLCLLLF